MSYFRGVQITGLTFGLIERATGVAVTTGTPVGYVTKDGGIQVELVNSAGGTGFVSEGNGQWSIDITKEEMDADTIGIVITHATAVLVNMTLPTLSSPQAVQDVQGQGDPATETGKVRILINDNDADIFTDAEIQFFLDENEQDIYLAAADALVSIAAGASLKAWLIRTGTKTKDFRRLHIAMLDLADKYRERAERIPALGYAEQNVSVFSGNEIDFNRILRNG